MEIKILERETILGLRPNWLESPTKSGESLQNFVREAMKETDRPKDYYQAWHRMLEYRSNGGGGCNDSMLTLSEGLHFFFKGASDKQVHDHYSMYLNFVVPPRKKQ